MFNVVTGGPETGKALVAHPGIDKIAFTGSTDVGKEIMRAAAGTLKRVSLELGGKSPNIVFADADLDAAVRGAINGIFYGKGEVCSAGSRLLVESRCTTSSWSKVVERAKKIAARRPARSQDAPGRPRQQAADADRSSATSRPGRSEGAKLVAGGKRARRATARACSSSPPSSAA